MRFKRYQSALQRIWRYFSTTEPDTVTCEKCIDEPEEIASARKAAVDSIQTVALSGEVNKINVCLETAIPSLTSACKRVEPDFLHLGRELQQVYAEATGLTELTVAAMNACGVSSSEAYLDRILSMARDTLSRQKQSHLGVGRGLSLLDRITTQLEKLDGLSDTIRNIAKSLKMVGLNVSIESSRYDEARDMFMKLSEDIKALSNTVFSVAASICGDAESARQRIQSVREEILETRGKFAALATNAEETIENTAPQVERIIHLSMEVMNKTGRQTGQISTQVGNVVVGIQIHDSISQRIAHIADSLEEILTLVNTEGNLDSEDKSDIDTRHLGGAYAIACLQVAQLSRLAEEVASVRETTLRAFHGIDGIVNDILEDMRSVGGAETTDPADSVPGNRSALFALKSALKGLSGLIGSGELRLNRIKEAITQSTDTVDRLSSHMVTVRDINFDIHLKALNAIVKSIKLGRRGRSIEVLVHEIKVLADRSNAFVADVQSIIDTIGNDTEALKKQALKSRDGEDANQDLQSFIQSFTDACASYDRHAQSVTGLGQGLKKALGEVVNRLRFMEAFEEELARNLGELNKLKELLHPYAKDGQGADAFDSDKIAQRYTMDKERMIHSRVFAFEEDEAIEVHPVNDLSFHSEISEEDQLSKGEGEGGISVLDSVVSGIGESKKVQNKEETLGDNVELF